MNEMVSSLHSHKLKRLPVSRTSFLLCSQALEEPLPHFKKNQTWANGFFLMFTQKGPSNTSPQKGTDEEEIVQRRMIPRTACEGDGFFGGGNDDGPFGGGGYGGRGWNFDGFGEQNWDESSLILFMG
ncbi:hypothetical protein Pint_25272 [Pistacia integerrima]|uniref:Uncharacterized protein n=1 Tax=Pistacia integerrima TaxID=434235 RepID=A0ACC0YB87_9ROSI|nr:hypothetical protein Pint_25272 [Pistacia integerrima]